MYVNLKKYSSWYKYIQSQGFLYINNENKTKIVNTEIVSIQSRYCRRCITVHNHNCKHVFFRRSVVIIFKILCHTILIWNSKLRTNQSYTKNRLDASTKVYLTKLLVWKSKECLLRLNTQIFMIKRWNLFEIWNLGGMSNPQIFLILSQE